MRVPAWNNTSITANESNIQSLKTCFFADSVAVQICKALAYCSVLLISLSGNTLLLIIVCKRQKLRRSVNHFIVNMAFSDFVFPLVGIPIKLTQIVFNSSHWRVSGVVGNILCKVYRFLTAASVTVSLQSLVWIAIDRFIAVMFPIRVRMISSKHRTVAVVSTWVVALAVQFPHMIITNLAKHDNMVYCVQIDDASLFKNKTLRSFNLATVAIFIIVPLVLIVTVYLIIVVTLKRRIKHLSQIFSHVQLQPCHRNARTVKMALCMMSAYGICFIPYLISSFVPDEARSCSLQNALSFFVVFMLYLSSIVNPIVCFSFVGSFRLELKEMFNGCFKNEGGFNSQAIRGQREIVLKSVMKLT